MRVRVVASVRGGSTKGVQELHLTPEPMRGARRSGGGRKRLATKDPDLVAALEAEARALGVRRLVLETGIRQDAALALYRATGFHPIPLYGEYHLSPETSVCLGKEL